MEFERERAELDALLASPLFSRAPQLSRFLSHVCERYFEGKADEIKEYSIAVEALGRRSGFDHTKDSIVRVEAHKLRKRLREYYDTEGADHEIQLLVPSGAYVPHFERRAAENGSVAAAHVRQRPASIGPDSSEDRLSRLGAKVWWAGAAVVAAALFVVLSTGGEPGGGAASNASAGTAGLTAPESLADDATLRLRAGAPDPPFVDEHGLTWVGDRYFEGGEAVEEDAPPASPPGLFQFRREGEFRYTIPLDPGTYELHLYFAETLYGSGNPLPGGEGTRLFDIAVNGRPALHDFDVISDAGGARRATVKVFTGLTPGSDGALRLGFHSPYSQAFLNGLEIYPGLPDRMRGVRILAGKKSYHFDNAHQRWGPDRFFEGGVEVLRSKPARGSDDQNLFGAERYGNFSYDIPVSGESTYTVRLMFSEMWFGDSNPGGGGVGSRVFDVACNGNKVLDRFDIYAEAGGENRAVVKELRGISPNGQERIRLEFRPISNYAMVNAIEVISEGRSPRTE